MIGIYSFTNKVNGKKYIGQSVQIEERVRRHKYDPYNPNNCWDCMDRTYVF